MAIGKQFLSAVLAAGSVSDFLQYGPIDHMFKANEIEAYNFVKEFVKHYQKLPAIQTLETHTEDELTPHIEAPNYYYDLMTIRYMETTVKTIAKQSTDMLLPENGSDAEGALKFIMDEVVKTVARKQRKTVLDFRNAYDLVITDYAAKFNSEQHGLYLGWPTFDAMTGGIEKKDVLSFVGRPGQGKTFQMLYSAHYGWDTAAKQLIANMAAAGSDMQATQIAQQSRLFLSMEMGQLPIQQRLSAMQTHVPISDVKLGNLDSKNLKILKKGLIEIQGYGAPFWIVDGNLASTVEDLWLLVRMLNPDACFVDGAYLLKHPYEKDRFKRAAENCELLKSEIAPICPVAASWQFAKNKNKGKKSTDKQDLDDIGYTDAIAQISTIVLGLLQKESVETIIRRIMDILKGRNGEVGQFETAWDFKKMNFSEVKPEKLEELSYI